MPFPFLVPRTASHIPRPEFGENNMSVKLTHLSKTSG